MAAIGLALTLPSTAVTMQKNAELWPDNNGVHVNAHGGGVIFHEGKFWWYGEHKEAGTRGNRSHGIAVHAYSSDDLVNWKDEGGALMCAKDPYSDLTDDCVVQRPKVLFCRKTGKFVMHFHLEFQHYGRNYLASRTGVAVSDTPQGPFRYLYGARPNVGCWPQGMDPAACRAAYEKLMSSDAVKYRLGGGDNPISRSFDIYLRDYDGGQMTRDQTMFVDDDGTAYQVSASEENSTLQIAELTDDYLGFTGRFWRMAVRDWTEAPAVFKHGGWYYLLGSGCTGWAPNTARLYRARQIAGPWERLGNPCVGTNAVTGEGADMTWGGQSAYVLKIPGSERQIAIFDIWRPKDAIDGRYVWADIDFSAEVPVIRWQDEWKQVKVENVERVEKVERSDELPPFPKWSAARRITDGPKEHLLASYFGIDSWSPNKRYVLVLETDINGRLPEANERCTLGAVDLEDGNRFIPITTTACWNFQEAAMAHWMSDDEIVFNDVRDGKFRAVVMNWRTKRERVLPRPVSAVSEDRTWAVSVNYARLSLTRPDYGYAGSGQDPLATVEWPEDDGLWTMDLKTGESKLVLPISAGRSLMPPTKRVAGKPGQPLAYYCHTVISKDGAKIFFLARSVDWYNRETHNASMWETTAFTVNRDGTELRRCFKDNWEGSHFNWAPDGSHRMLVTAIWDGDKKGYWMKNKWSPVEFTVGEEEKVRRIGAGILDLDWHCIYSPDGQFMSGETYYDKEHCRPWVLVRLQDGAVMPMGEYYVPEAYRSNYWRCDLHARYRPDGRQIAFNSVHEGSRQVYVRDIR